jgi:DNA-binding transcriptional regulator YdaS (Cro superfamily)
MTAIEKAVAAVGGRQALADICSVRYQAVEKWVRLDRVPAERVLQIEKATKGAVTRHELRPDLYPRNSTLGFSGLSAP